MLCKSIEMLCGFELIETEFITKKVQARKHKKKRINKKWLKRYGTKEVPDYENVVIANNCIYAQPRTITKIKDAVNKGERARELYDEIMRMANTVKYI